VPSLFANQLARPSLIEQDKRDIKCSTFNVVDLGRAIGLTMSLELVSSLQDVVNSLPKYSSDVGDAERKTIVKLARELLLRMESPQDLIRRIGYEVRRQYATITLLMSEGVLIPSKQSHSQQLCLRLAVDLGIFDHLARSSRHLSSADIARVCNAEELLVVRILRVLTAVGLAREVGAQMYTATPASVAMTDAAQEAMVRSASDDTVQIFAQLPQVLKQRGYRCPTDALDCPLQWTMGTRLRYFDWVAQSPQQAKDLTVSMKAMQASSNSQQWFEYYLVEERLLQGWSNEDCLLVDIGGGMGQDLKQFAESFKQIAAYRHKLILQDLPEVISGLDTGTLDGIRVMDANFFDPQPIRGKSDE
jgi:hypothetical protein